MKLNAFMQRIVALLACLCLAASGTSVAWAQANLSFGEPVEINNGAEIQLFLAQADFGALGFDITAPTISHTPPTDSSVAGEVQTVVADISDNQSVANAMLIYRNSTSDFYATTDMSPDSTNSTWLATIDTTTEDTQVYYYIVAEDSDGNRVQKGSESNPLTILLEQPQTLFSAITPAKKDNRNRWIAVGLGVLALGAILAAGGGGGGGSDDGGIINSDDECCTVTFTVPNVDTE